MQFLDRYRTDTIDLRYTKRIEALGYTEIDRIGNILGGEDTMVKVSEIVDSIKKTVITLT